MLARYSPRRAAAFLVFFLFSCHLAVHGQSGSSTSITGVVVDPSGAVIPNATVEVRNLVSGFSRSAVTDAAGKFSVPTVHDGHFEAFPRLGRGNRRVELHHG